MAAVRLSETLRDWYLSHLENNDDGSGLISTIAIRDAALNGLCSQGVPDINDV